MESTNTLFSLQTSIDAFRGSKIVREWVGYLFVPFRLFFSLTFLFLLRSQWVRLHRATGAQSPHRLTGDLLLGKGSSLVCPWSCLGGGVALPGGPPCYRGEPSLLPTGSLFLGLGRARRTGKLLEII